MSPKKKFQIEKEKEEEALSEDQLKQLEEEEKEEDQEKSADPLDQRQTSVSEKEPEKPEEENEQLRQKNQELQRKIEQLDPKKQPERKVALDINLNAEQRKFKGILDKQPKITMSIPLYPGEKVGTAYETCTINDYRFQIPKGKMVALPKQIAEMLMEHYNIQSDPSQLAPEYSLARNPEKVRDLER